MARLVSKIARRVEDQEIPALLDKLLKKVESGGYLALEADRIDTGVVKRLQVVSSLVEAERMTARFVDYWFAKQVERILQEPTEFPFREKGHLSRSWTGAGRELRRKFQQIRMRARETEVTVENLLQKIEEVEKETEELKVKIGAEYVRWGEEITKARIKMNACGSPSNPALVAKEYDKCWNYIEEARAGLEKLDYEKVKSSLAEAGKEIEKMNQKIAREERLRRQKEMKVELMRKEYSSCPVCGERIKFERSDIHACMEEGRKKLTIWTNGQKKTVLKQSFTDTEKFVVRMTAEDNGWNWVIRREENPEAQVDYGSVETRVYYKEPEPEDEALIEAEEAEEVEEKPESEGEKRSTIEDLAAAWGAKLQ